MVVRRTINTQNENVVPIVLAFILWQRRPLPARSLTPFFYPRTGSKRVWRASLDRRRGIGEAGASSTCPAVGFGLTDDAASQASRCSARRLLNNLRQVSNKVPAVQPQRQLRLPQIRAGDGARLRAGLPALRIRTGRVATSSEGKDSGSGVRYSFRQQ